MTRSTTRSSRPRIARALGLEQGQLALAGVGADEREVVGAVDDVHPEALAEQLGQRLAIRDPERHVVEAVGFDASGEVIDRASPVLPDRMRIEKPGSSPPAGRLAGLEEPDPEEVVEALARHALRRAR